MFLAITVIVGVAITGGCSGSNSDTVAPDNPQPLAGPDLDRDAEVNTKKFEE